MVSRACSPPAPRQREDVNQYAMGCETMKKSLELEKQRYRGLLEQRVVDTGEAKLAADSARAANAILQKAIKEYDVWTPIFSLIFAHAKRLLAIRAFVCVNMESRFKKGDHWLCAPDGCCFGAVLSPCSV
jgi:hypothetical protein